MNHENRHAGAPAPSVVLLRDDAAGLRAELPLRIVRGIGLPLPLRRFNSAPPHVVLVHDVASCTDPRCGACAALLCPEDDHRHLQQSGCPWSRCAATGPTSAALVEARVACKLIRLDDPPPPEVPDIVARALASTSIFLRGMAAGGVGVGPILRIVDEALDALGLAATFAPPTVTLEEGGAVFDGAPPRSTWQHGEE